MNEQVTPLANPGRRDFLKEAAAEIISAILGLVPVAAGLRVFFDPLRRKAGSGAPVRITTLDSLPDDGVPRKFQVIAGSVDAWNKYKSSAIGAVYLRRTKDGK